MWLSYGLLLVFLVPNSLAEFNPSDALKNLHLWMNGDELAHYFRVDSHEQVPEYEITFVKQYFRFPASNQNDSYYPSHGKRNSGQGKASNSALYSFSAFGRDYHLKFRKNSRLVSPWMQVIKRTAEGDVVIESFDQEIADCHYLHQEGDTVASLSHCSADDVRGFIIDKHPLPLELYPLTPRLREMLTDKNVQASVAESEDEMVLGAHLVRRSDQLPEFAEQMACSVEADLLEPLEKRRVDVTKTTEKPKDSEEVVPINKGNVATSRDLKLASEMEIGKRKVDIRNSTEPTPVSDTLSKYAKLGDEAEEYLGFEKRKIDIISSTEPMSYTERPNKYAKLGDEAENYINEIDGSLMMDKRKEGKKQAKTTKQTTKSSKPTAAEPKKILTKAGGVKTLELGVFLDEAAYRLYSPYYRGNDKAIRDMLLAFVNGMQALYALPSLGKRIELTIVYMELQQKQPADLPTANGERGALLDNFCAYHAKYNPAGDSNPKHWDMGLYISGLDFYAMEGGKPSYITMGLAAVGGVCYDKYSCVIGELGVSNSQGKPYPSAGFTSVYVMAHEIGHNLGLSHDSTGNSCPAEGFIMSPSRGVVGETKWSTCSATSLANMKGTCLDDSSTPPTEFDHNLKYGGVPGQSLDANMQCQFLLRDRDASVYDPAALSEACNSLKCKTPNRDGYYLAGPALEGTYCAPGKMCSGGDCVTASKPPTTVQGGWTDWQNEPCKSGCLADSKGAILSWRTCTNPKPINTLQGCEGPSSKVTLCDDSNLCPAASSRADANEYASRRCTAFSQVVRTLSPTGPGLQASYAPDRIWQSCAIFCKRADTGAWYTPRLELNDLGIDAYFPEGTWCHNDGTQDYYCMQRHCLPQNYNFGRALIDGKIKIDTANNAIPSDDHKHEIPKEVQEYFTLDDSGKALRKDLGAMPSPPSHVPRVEVGKHDNDFVTFKP